MYTVACISVAEDEGTLVADQAPIRELLAGEPEKFRVSVFLVEGPRVQCHLPQSSEQESLPSSTVAS